MSSLSLSHKNRQSYLEPRAPNNSALLSFHPFCCERHTGIKKNVLEMESCCFSRAVFKIRNILAAAAYTAEITDEVTALGRSKSLSKIFNEDYINSMSLSQSFYVDACK